ncbi:MAG: DMT family transporter [Caldisericaceae bacterium]
MKERFFNKSFLVNASLVGLFFIWANAYTLIKIAGRDLSPTSIAMARFFIVFPFLFFFPSLYRIFRVDKRDILKIILIGILIVPSYHLFLNNAETMINASVAALVAGFSPVLTGIFSSLILKEKLGEKRIFGFAVSVIGVLVLTYGISASFQVKNSLGVLLSLSSVTSWALSTVLSKSLYDKYRPLDVTVWAIFIGTLLLVFFLRPQNVYEIMHMSAQSLFAIIYLGFLCILLGYGVWFKALEFKEATSTGAFVYLNPIIGSLSGVIFLQEKINFVMLIGGLVIILGLFFVNPLRMQKH